MISLPIPLFTDIRVIFQVGLVNRARVNVLCIYLQVSARTRCMSVLECSCWVKDYVDIQFLVKFKKSL